MIAIRRLGWAFGETSAAFVWRLVEQHNLAKLRNNRRGRGMLVADGKGWEHVDH